MDKRFEETIHHRRCTNKHIKRCPATLVIRKNLIKITMKFSTLHVLKKDYYNKCWQRYGKSGTFIYFWYECIKMVQPLWKSLAVPKKLIINLPQDTEMSFLLSTQKICKMCLRKYLHLNIHNSISHMRQNIGKIQLSINQ